MEHGDEKPAKSAKPALPGPTRDEREARLAKALRANLRRRKTPAPRQS
jgi:hypothetical protein